MSVYLYSLGAPNWRGAGRSTMSKCGAERACGCRWVNERGLWLGGSVKRVLALARWIGLRGDMLPEG